MPDSIHQYEPLWGSWYVDTMLGAGSFGKVYRVRKEEFGETYYSAVKIISVPNNEQELENLLNEGYDEDSARSYFHTFVSDILQEIRLMNQFRGNSNIVSLEDHKVVEKKAAIGWDILIRMELLTSLTKWLQYHTMTQRDVVTMGIHICRALELCAQKNTIHRDIKPENIFISPFGEYKLGDFGIARQIERTMSGLSKKGTYTYMAPEVYRGDDYNATVDLYSLGIVMYRLLNQNRPPFSPPFPHALTPREREEALTRRMRGEMIPPIQGMDPRLNAVVLKACTFDRKARYRDASEMRKALERILNSEGLQAGQDTPVAMRQAGGAEDSKQRSDDSQYTFSSGSFQPSGRPLRSHEQSAMPNMAAKKKPRSLVPLIIALSVLMMGIIALAGALLLRPQGDIGERITEVSSTLSLEGASTDTPKAESSSGSVDESVAEPAAKPTATVALTASQTSAPTPSPTSTPTSTPTPSPTSTPTSTPTPSPTSTPTSTPTPSPTSTPTSTPTPPPTSTLMPIQSGETITFGQYEQDNDNGNGKEPVEWMVLDVDYSGGKALLLSKYILDMQRYHSSWSKVSWRKCSVHSWLNGKFLKACFSSDERKAIISTNIKSYYVDEYVETYDYVFFLSVDEAAQYLPSSAERQARPTAYAVAREVALKDGICYWWLRDSTNRKNDANRVNPQGSFEEYGANTNAYGVGVRPAVWVDFTMFALD